MLGGTGRDTGSADVNAKAVPDRTWGVQIVGYEPTPSPALQLAEEGRVRRHPLELGDTLSFPLGERHCAGRVDGDRHRPCDELATPRCDRHTETWVCARCRGTCLKDEMDCHVEHDVYLAAFAPDVFKVGVTRTGRLRERLTEQGADRGVRIRRVANGRIAREVEAEIAATIPDRVSVDTKIDGLAETIDESAWKALLSEYAVAERCEPSYHMALSEPPVPETLARGEIVGLKGRLLCLTWAGSTFATDLRALVGHEVAEEAPSRQVQSGLGAFS